MATWWWDGDRYLNLDQSIEVNFEGGGPGQRTAFVLLADPRRNGLVKRSYRGERADELLNLVELTRLRQRVSLELSERLLLAAQAFVEELEAGHGFGKPAQVIQSSVEGNGAPLADMEARQDYDPDEWLEDEAN